MIHAGPQRYVYVADSTESYWPSVDKHLKELEGEDAEVRNEWVSLRRTYLAVVLIDINLQYSPGNVH